jgi:hypothetical protein
MAFRHDLAVAGVMAHARATELAGRRGLQVFSRLMHFGPVRRCHRIDQHGRALFAYGEPSTDAFALYSLFLKS